MLRILGILIIVVVVAVLSVAGGIYLYLAPDDEPPRIASPSSLRTVSTGELVGFQSKHDAHAWLGIPYGAPPTGDMRWRAPLPADPWSGRRQVLDWGSPCPQLQFGSQEPVLYGDEDCLYLNIWAPKYGPTTIPAGEERLPVMVWIHGGGNTLGSGGSEIMQIYDGSLMASEHKVIVVSMNYRLGSFGWFIHDALINTSTTPEDASGNYGTLDLLLALSWVQENIAAFGGDPGNVTIYGESAGGYNVLSLMASPLAEGLFHRAIVQSGGLEFLTQAFGQGVGMTPRQNPRMSSTEVAARLMVNKGRSPDRETALVMLGQMSDTELADWLRSVTSEEIIAVFDESFFGMVEVPNIFGDGHVLPAATTREVFSDPARYQDVPLIIGTNRDETALFLSGSPDHVRVSGGMPVEIYDPVAYRRDVRYGSDMWRAYGADNFANWIGKDRPEQVWSYRFDADDWRNYGFIDLKVLIGAAHAMELPFVFGYFPAPGRVIFPDSTFEEVELLSSAMMSYWAEFAYNGAPGTGRDGELPHWLPWQQDEPGHFMILDTEIDDGIRMDHGVVTMEEVSNEFFKDPSYVTAEEKCAGYRSVFGFSFDRQQYESLGCQ